MNELLFSPLPWLFEQPKMGQLNLPSFGLGSILSVCDGQRVLDLPSFGLGAILSACGGLGQYCVVKLEFVSASDSFFLERFFRVGSLPTKLATSTRSLLFSDGFLVLFTSTPLILDSVCHSPVANFLFLFRLE